MKKALTLLALVWAFASGFAMKKAPHIVFLINNDPLNYEAHQTVPEFSEKLKTKGFRVTVLSGQGTHNSIHFPGFEAVAQADLVVVFFRRLALSNAQMKIFKDYLDKGKPLMGIRTANHAFSVTSGPIPAGHEDWKEFVPQILGCLNRGYGPTAPGTEVSVIQQQKNHPILKGISSERWHSNGNVYLVAPLLDEKAVVLLEGKVEDKTEPVAWTRKLGKQKVFYTSLGYPDDFKMPEFTQLLENAISWLMKK